MTRFDPLSHQQTTLERVGNMICCGVYFFLALIGAVAIGAIGFIWYGGAVS